MIALLSFKLFILNIAGWVLANWRIVMTVLAAFLLFVFVIFAYKQCTKPAPAKVDHTALEELRVADEARQKAIVEKIVTENAESVIAADERAEIAIENVETRDAVIAEKIAEVDKKVTEARRSGSDVTEAELKCILGSKEFCE